MIADMSTYQRGNVWWIKIYDHLNRPIRMSSHSSTRKVAVGLQDHIRKLVDHVGNGLPVPTMTMAWVHNHLDRKRLAILRAHDLIDDRRLAIGAKLPVHLDAWHSYVCRGNTEKYANLRKHRAETAFEHMEATHYADITGESVVSFLQSLDASQSTRNHYLSAIKGFCSWMVKNDRADRQPPGLGTVKPEMITTPKKVRRSLTVDEESELLSAPDDRRTFYLLALDAGLRAKEIRTLTADNFDSKERTVTLEAKNTKNKRTDTLPMSDRLATAAKAHLRAHDGFDVPIRTAEMLRKDLPGTDHDFHSLRHTFITNLARAGVHPKLAQELARHSTITLTMEFYTHLTLPERAQAIAAANCARERALSRSSDARSSATSRTA